MKERLVTLVCALGALALFVAMFLRGGPALTRTHAVARPTTLEESGNGYAAAKAWLTGAGIATRSLRRPWDTLEHDATLAPRGNLLIVTLPGVRPIGNAELAALRRWIAAGNTLLVAATFSDAPDWALSVGGLGRGDPEVLTGLDFESVRSRDSRRQPHPSGRLSAERLSEAVPNTAHPYFSGVQSLVAVSDFAPQMRELRIPFDGFALELAHLKATGEGAFWTRTRGEGRVLVSALGTLWTNRALGRADNARFLGNLIAASTSAAGAVIFDDGHQGVAPGYDPATFFADPRLKWTALIALFLWLSWVVGATRLPSAPARPRGLPEEDLIAAGGGLFARTVAPHAAGLRLFALFAARLNIRGDLWDTLARNPRVREEELRQARTWYDRCAAGRRVPLAKLYNLLLSLESRLA